MTKGLTSGLRTRRSRAFETRHAHLLVAKTEGLRTVRSARARIAAGALYGAAAIAQQSWGASALPLVAILASGVAHAAATHHDGRPGLLSRRLVALGVISETPRPSDRSVNIPGLMESLAWLLALVPGLYLMHPESDWSRVAQVAAVYLASLASNIALDASHYRPLEGSGAAVLANDALRAGAGPLCALLIAALFPWALHPDLRLLSFTLAAGQLGITVRVRDHELLLAATKEVCDYHQELGRADVVRDIHAQMSPPLGKLVGEAQERSLGATMPDLYGLVIDADGGLREVLHANSSIDSSSHPDWPGTLIADVSHKAGLYGIPGRMECAPDLVISSTDRRLARALLADLVSNAGKSGATSIDAVIERDGDLWSLSVTDDGRPFPPGTEFPITLRPGGSLVRHHASLTALGGSLGLAGAPHTKTVTARWTARATGEGR